MATGQPSARRKSLAASVGSSLRPIRASRSPPSDRVIARSRCFSSASPRCALRRPSLRAGSVREASATCEPLGSWSMIAVSAARDSRFLSTWTSSNTRTKGRRRARTARARRESRIVEAPTFGSPSLSGTSPRVSFISSSASITDATNSAGSLSPSTSLTQTNGRSSSAAHSASRVVLP